MPIPEDSPKSGEVSVGSPQSESADMSSCLPASGPGVAALELIKGDPLDVYLPQLKGYKSLNTARLILGRMAPAAAFVLFEQGMNVVPVVGEAALLLGAAAISTAVSLASGVIRPRRAAKAETQQQAAREGLGGEPIDLITTWSSRSPKGFGRHRPQLTLRWYGADAAFRRPGETDASLKGRFEKVVGFAEKHPQVTHVAMTRRLAGEELHDDDITCLSTAELLRAYKGKTLDVRDYNSDPELLALRVADARELADGFKKDKGAETVPRVQALADALLDRQPNHPLAPLWREWQAAGRPEAMKQNIIAAVSRPLQERLANRHTTQPMRGSGGRKLATDVHVAMTPFGANITERSREAVRGYDDRLNQPSVVEVVPFAKLLGLESGESMDEHIAQLLRRLNDGAANADSPQEQESDLLSLETALYYDLISSSKERGLDGSNRAVRTAAESPKTLYQRMLQERPRSRALGIGLRPRGAHTSKGDQTIEYRRSVPRVLARKVAIGGLAALVGGGIGLGWSWVWDNDTAHQMACEPALQPEFSHNTSPALCTPESPVVHTIAAGANGLVDREDNLEHWVADKAVRLGVPPNDVAGLSQWGTIKWDSLRGLYNPYGGEGSSGASPVGDVSFPNGNQTLWSLSPRNGAGTAGYWPSSVNDTLNLTPQVHVDTPPYQGLSVAFESSKAGDSVLAMPKEEIAGAGIMYPIEVSSEPPQGAPLIEVSGDRSTDAFNTQVKLFDATNTAGLDGRHPNGDDGYSLALPVIQGGTIAAARVTVKELGTDTVVSQPKLEVYQLADGTFHLFLEKGALSRPNDTYTTIQYWVRPDVSPPVPAVRTVRPLTVDASAAQPGSDGPISGVLSPAEAAILRQMLGVPDNASPSDIALAISRSHKYSFTPYSDAGNPVPLRLDGTQPAGEVLTNLAATAQNMPNEECNMAAFEAAVAMRNPSINDVVGFRPSTGEGLTSANSHTWLTDRNGNIIDATPATPAHPLVIPPAKPLQIPTQGEDLNALWRDMKWGIAAAAFIGLEEVARRRRLLQKAVRKAQADAADYSRRWFEKDNPLRNEAVDRMRHILWAPDDQPFHPAAASVGISPISIPFFPDGISLQAIKNRAAARGMRLTPADLQDMRAVLRHRRRAQGRR